MPDYVHCIISGTDNAFEQTILCYSITAKKRFAQQNAAPHLVAIVVASLASVSVINKKVYEMFKDKNIAEDISALMLDIGSILDASVSRVQQTCDESELNTYRSAVGEIMGRMLIDIMNPIYKQHPELKPKELN
ncbi:MULTISPECIES: hypothetical protein [Escherichia]|uniref:hypothetical protein n=2 Tax=Enterobacteriaceae TaxID=543 RepID=UPI001F548389|nr:hypothetical protein [Escherichia sp. MOD1-EC5350]MEB7938338.1 hypothetical protein [Escherichia whittamii]